MNEELMVYDENKMFILHVPETLEEKKSFVNSMSNCDYSGDDVKDKVITMVNFNLSKIFIESNNGEKVLVDRLIIYDKDGKSYNIMGTGIGRDITNIVSVYGFWGQGWPEEGINIMIIKRKHKNGYINTIKLV